MYYFTNPNKFTNQSRFYLNRKVLERSLIEQRSTLALCPEKLSRNNTQLRLDTLKFSLTFTKKVWNISEVIHPFLEALQEMQGGSLFRSCLMEEKVRGCKYWLTTSMANRVPSIAAVRSTDMLLGHFGTSLVSIFPYQGLSSCLLPKQADLISVQHIKG